MKLYKVLVDGKSCHGGDMAWSLPQKQDGSRKYIPGAWQHVAGKLAMCIRGIHLTSQPEHWLKVGCEIFQAESDVQPTIWNDDKCVVSGARLLRPVRKPAYWEKVESFVAEIPEVKFFAPDGDPDPGWKLFTGENWAAARDAAWAAARAAAWDAARAAAWAAACDAAWAAAWDAAWAAALMVGVAVCDGFNLDQKSIDHTRARWRVWEKGYALLCDVNGVLYVYAPGARQ